MRNEIYKLEMPKKYRELTEEEMEYDGGFFNFGVAIVASVLSVGFAVAAEATGDDRLMLASHACAAVSMVSGGGVTLIVRSAMKQGASAATKNLASKIGVKTQKDYVRYKRQGKQYFAVGVASTGIKGYIWSR